MRRSDQRERDQDPPPTALCRDFPSGHRIASHVHRRSHLIYVAAGTIVATTEQGRWVVPQGKAIWIPGGLSHEIQMINPVTTLTVWIDNQLEYPLSSQCRVLEVYTLMLGLLMKAIDVDAEGARPGRRQLIIALLLDELAQLPAASHNLPFPLHKSLAKQCNAFVQHPHVNETIEDWCDALGMSRRTFTRLFRNETGLSFLQWRQQACLLAALPRLIAREPIASVALELGYDSSAAFATMFKRQFGFPPSQYNYENTAERAG